MAFSNGERTVRETQCPGAGQRNAGEKAPIVERVSREKTEEKETVESRVHLGARGGENSRARKREREERVEDRIPGGESVERGPARRERRMREAERSVCVCMCGPRAKEGAPRQQVEEEEPPRGRRWATAGARRRLRLESARAEAAASRPCMPSSRSPAPRRNTPGVYALGVPSVVASADRYQLPRAPSRSPAPRSDAVDSSRVFARWSHRDRSRPRLVPRRDARLNESRLSEENK